MLISPVLNAAMKSHLLAIALLLAPLCLQTPVTALNAAHLEQLQRTGSCVECDLSSAQLPDALLSNTDLRGANLTGANLRGVNNCNLMAGQSYPSLVSLG